MQSKGAISSPGATSAWRWHLLLTKPLGELIAAANLERQGYRVYYPRVKERVLSRRVWREAVSSLFPRYLFVQLNAAAQSLAPIRSTLGVSSVVRFGQEYAVVPDEVVADLKDRADPQSGLHNLGECSFRRGHVVRIVEGPLAGLDGIFESHEAQDRVVILLDLLGCESRIRIAVNNILPA